MTERVSVNSKVIELNEQESNDIFMVMHLKILSNAVNLNKAVFTSEFIDGVVSSKSRYLGIPFLVNREALENDEYLTHELNQDTGELGTDQIGSFIDFWKEEEEDGSEVLMGSIKIFKRFGATCDKIVEMVEDNSLATSCEVLVSSYEEVSDDGVRSIHYNDGKNALIGSAIVTDAAMPSAKPTLLIAEAYAEDIKAEQKGGEDVTKASDKEYNNGIKVKHHGVEVASLQYFEIEKKIYNTLNPVDVENGGRDYNYWIYDLYNDKVIVECADKYDLYSINYKIENDTVILDKQEDWQKGSYQFVPDGVTVAELMENNTLKITKLERELSELKEEKKNMSKKKELTVEELNEKIEQLDKEVSELKEVNEGLEATIVSQKEEAVKAEKTAKELSDKIEELAPFKEQVEKAELESKQTELKDKYSKVLSEEVFASEEVVEAIKELDETKLNSIVVAETLKETSEKTKEETVEVSAVKTKEDLIETSPKNYLFSTRK